MQFKIKYLILLLVVLLSGCVQGYTNSDIKPAESVTIYTRDAGIVRVNFNELKAIGLQINQASQERLQLSRRGKPQGFLVDGTPGREALILYADPSDSLYTRETIYQLSFLNNQAQPINSGMLDSPVKRGRLNASIIPESGAYIETLHLEENHIYLPQVVQGEHWLWMNLPAPQVKKFTAALSHMAEAMPARLRLAVYSNTESALDPDHELRIALNGYVIGGSQWEGAGYRLITLDFPSDILQDGENVIEVEAPGFAGQVVDLYYVDWIDIDFARFPNAIDNQLEFVQPVYALVLSNFDEPIDIYDISDTSQLIKAASRLRNGDSFNGVEGHLYYAVGRGGYHQAGRLTSNQAADNLLLDNKGANYLVIGPSTLLKPLLPLLEYRNSLGLVTKSTPVEIIFDLFNHGYPEPEAIQNYLAYANSSWLKKPKYVLLVGDASYDPRGFLAPIIDNLMPAYLVNTVYGGETVSDVDYAQLNEDPWPDLSVGILPARTTQQVQTFVEKTLAYEHNYATNRGEKQQILGIADGQDASFRYDAQAFLGQFPANMSTVLYAPEAGVTTGSQEIQNLWKGSNTIIAYFGHGSVNMWGKDRLFTTEDVQKLHDITDYPIVINMTCLTGLYTHPKVVSLAEALLWAPRSGAVAVLAPSSLTLPTDQTILSRSFVEALLATGGSTLGDAHLQARRQIPIENPGTMDVMRTFMLFGDPALRIGRKTN
jgi:hypothetical protein